MHHLTRCCQHRRRTVVVKRERLRYVIAGATAVADLGRAAYRVGLPASGNAGLGVEVGWLTGNGRLIVLQFRFPAGTADTQVEALVPKLVTLARQIDQSSL